VLLSTNAADFLQAPSVLEVECTDFVMTLEFLAHRAEH